VHLKRGLKRTIYEVLNAHQKGPGVGAVSYHPFKNQVVFIHGLQNASDNYPYAGYRRTGVIVDELNPGVPIFMDSRDVIKPFTPGALRGGTHRHQWSADGDWIGFTYNDALMVALEEKTGKSYDLRTVGVAHRNGPKVLVDRGDGNIQGAWYSALVVRVVPEPTPGTNEIKKAYGDWWVGTEGYPLKNGGYQRSRAFMGDVVTCDGKEITEVFIVDIPEQIHFPGEAGPLQGSETQMPMPPKGAITKRLTFSEGRRFPGTASVPRHWLSSSMDGTYISFLAKDEGGIVQVYLVSPHGGERIQASFHTTDVQSTVRWHPKNREFTYICDNRIFLNTVDEKGSIGNAVGITERSQKTPFAHCFSRNGDRIVFNSHVVDNGEEYIQIFLAEKP
ncbi:MAG: DUF3748 domain-containing protein, partial [Cyclobacteriaceae bacterium]